MKVVVRYDRSRVLGEGRFAFVYEALLEGYIRVAVKRIQKEHFNNSPTEKEIRIMQEVNHHPNIVKFIGYRETNDFLFIVTEFCVGTLHDWVEKKYDEERTIGMNERKMLHQVTKGLDYLHKNNVIHRDIKPTNLLIFVPDDDEESIMKIADFGLSQVLQRDQVDLSTEPRTDPRGTRGWIAPELYEPGRRYDSKVDIFPLGCVFGYTLSRRKHHPFGNDLDHRSKQIKEKQQPEFLTMKDMKEEYSNDAVAFELIESMIKMDPSERPTTGTILSNPFFLDYDLTPPTENEGMITNQHTTTKSGFNEMQGGNVIIEEMTLSTDQHRTNNMKEQYIFDITMSTPPRQLLKTTMIVIIVGLFFAPSQHIVKPKMNDVRAKELLELCSYTSKMTYKEVENFYELVQDVSVDVNATDPLNGMNALLKLSLNYGHDNLIELLQPLIKRGIDVTTTDQKGWNALHNLCRYYVHENLVELIWLLIEESTIDLQVKTEEGHTALHLLAFENPANFTSKKIVIEILSVDGDLLEVAKIWRLQEFSSTSKLFDNDLDRFKELVATMGLNKVQTNELLILSSSIPRLLEKEVARFRELVEDDGVNINATDRKDGMNALLKLSRSYGHDNIIQLVRPLIKRGIHVNATDPDGWNALHNFCRYYKHNNLIDLIRLLHESNIEFKATTKEGSIQLYLDAFEENPALLLNAKEIFEILPKEEEFLEIMSKIWTNEFLKFFSCTSRLSEQELVGFITLLKDGSVDVNARDPNEAGMNALLKLTRNYGHDNLISLIRPLIEEGIDVNATDSNGWNALHNLCRYYGPENLLIDLIALLEESTIDMEAKTNEGYSALYLAAYMNPTISTSEEILKILYKGDDFSQVLKNRTREFYLLLTSESKLTDQNITRFTELVNDKTTVNVNHAVLDRATADATATAAKKKNLMFVPGGNALHLLCRFYSHDNLIDLARPLIGRGVDVNATDSIGRNALHFLFQYYDHDNLIQLLEYFIDKSVDVNGRTKAGWSPLHVLFRYYRRENMMALTKMLIDTGKVNLDARNSRKWTPLHHLCRYYDHRNVLDIVLLLEEHGANLEAKTVDGHLPFYLLKKSGKNLYGLTKMTSDVIVTDELLKIPDFSPLSDLTDWWSGSTDDTLNDDE